MSLVEVKTKDFTAVLPEFQSLPYAEISIVLSSSEYEQLEAMVDLIKRHLSPEKVEEFDKLTVSQVMPFIQEWVVGAIDAATAAEAATPNPVELFNSGVEDERLRVLNAINDLIDVVENRGTFKKSKSDVAIIEALSYLMDQIKNTPKGKGSVEL